MWWRLPHSQFERQRGEENRRALKGLVDAGQAPGILAYAEGRLVAWCSLGPREAFPTLERSRILKRVDEQAVWSVVCFYVARGWRRKGIMVPLLVAAVEYAREHGARIVEGYPIEPRGQTASASLYTGLASAFRKAGFVEVARRSETRSIMRYAMQDEN
jgi:GNAT superfamily N-acetyltransferase